MVRYKVCVEINDSELCANNMAPFHVLTPSAIGAVSDHLRLFGRVLFCGIRLWEDRAAAHRRERAQCAVRERRHEESMAQFVAHDDCGAPSANRSIERIHRAVETLAAQVESEEGAQSVLDIGNQLLAQAVIVQGQVADD